MRYVQDPWKQRKRNIIVSAKNAIDRILKDNKYTDVMKK